MNSPAIRKKVLVGMILLLAISFPVMIARADGSPFTTTFSTDVLSQYIWRGLAFSKDSAVIQPSITMTYGDWSANVWGNFDTARHSDNPFYLFNGSLLGQEGNAKWSETDITVSWTHTVCTNFSVLLGNVYYAVQPPLSATDLDEVFGGVSYTFPWFTAAFTSYGEVTHTADVWLELDLTRSIPTDCLYKGSALNLDASFGYSWLPHHNNILDEEGDLGSFSQFQTCWLTANLTFPICKYVTIAPKIGVSLPLTDRASNYLDANSLDGKAYHVWGGLNVTATF